MDDAERPRPLQKIGTLCLLGRQYDIAKNGGFHLVQNLAPDAYGRPVAQVVNVGALCHGPTIQALLDCLGDTMVALQAARSMNSGRGEGEGR